MVVVIWALAIASGANIRFDADGRLTHRDETGGRSANAAVSHSIRLPFSSSGVSCTDAWKLADRTSTGEEAVFRRPVARLGTGANERSRRGPYQIAKTFDTLFSPCNMLGALAGASHVTY